MAQRAGSRDDIASSQRIISDSHSVAGQEDLTLAVPSIDEGMWEQVEDEADRAPGDRAPLRTRFRLPCAEVPGEVFR